MFSEGAKLNKQKKQQQSTHPKMPSPKGLIALTSYNDIFYDDGAKTGVFLVEALHPFNEYKAKGYKVQFVSETGKFGWDDHSLTETFLKGQDKKDYENQSSDFQIALKQIKKASDVNPDDYKIFFAAAGHGSCFDFPTATGLQDLALKIYVNGGVIAAVCHGPVIFAGLKDKKTGENIAKGKSLTGFTDEGEEIMGVDKIMKQKGVPTVCEIFKECGIKYMAPLGPWDDFSLTDGKFVTGVNPASAGSTAKRSIIALNE